MSEEIIKYYPRSNGKAFMQFTEFVKRCKLGQSCLFFGGDYVAMDKTTYNTMIAEQERRPNDQTPTG